MMNDVRGAPSSCTDARALDGFETALGRYLTFVGDPLEAIDRVLAEYPGFVLGHIFRVAYLMTAGERRLLDYARSCLAEAEALCHGANDREKGLLEGTRALVDGEWHDACAAFERVLTDYPRDLFALHTAHLFDFYRGDAMNLRNRVARVLPDWNADVPGYAYVLGMHAFGLEECNQYADAEATGRSALELERRNAWAVHAVAHVMEMCGRIDDGIDWLESRRADWAPHNGFAVHNFWHLALFRLDRAEFDAARAVYDSAVYPEPSDLCVVLVDATALLWRLDLEREPIGQRANVLADVWRRRIDEERGFYAFNDAHAALAFCLAGDLAEARRLGEYLEGVAHEGRGSNAATTANVGLPLVRAFIAFAEGEYARAIDYALPVRDRAHTFGGSHAQRDLITLTLIESALRSQRYSLARHLIAERIVQRPNSELGFRLLARAHA